MSGNEWRPVGPNGPGYPATYTRDHVSSSSRTVPIYVLFLIMLGSGVFTLIFLWVCVQYIYHKRRVGRARTADVEEFAASAPDVKELTVVSQCHEELTYVVMAGEETPTFLARPLSDLDPPPPPPPPDVDAAHAVVSSDLKTES